MTLLLTIEGMSCAHCSTQVLEALTQLPGVRSVKVSKGSAQVKGEELDQDTICKAVEEAGYAVVDIREKESFLGI